jgi:hypothetical protein
VLGSSVTQDKFNRKEAARYISEHYFRIAPQTLTNMASNNNAGHGPPFVRYGWSRVVYHRDAIDAWAKSRVQEIGYNSGVLNGYRKLPAATA